MTDPSSSSKEDKDKKEKEDKEKKEKEEKEKEKEPVLTPSEKLIADIKQNVALLERSVSTNERRYITRVLRSLSSVRRRLNVADFRRVLDLYFPEDSAPKLALLDFVPPAPPEATTIATTVADESAAAMEVDGEANEPAVTKAAAAVVGSGKQPPKITAPGAEVELYLSLLCLLLVVDATKDSEKGMQLALRLVQRAAELNRRAADAITAKIFFYLARCYEDLKRFDQLRTHFLEALRTTTLRRDEEIQATLLNELLRYYLRFNLVEQADKLVSKSTFPESVGNNQHVRYEFYLGRIKAIRLEYSMADKHFEHAIRKAPQSPAAPGFQQVVHKWSTIVKLLLGEIPKRSTFRSQVLRKPLQPYIQLTQAVRVGDLLMFQNVMSQYSNQFRADKTYTLILRLRHNVIKTGLRMISLSYSRISMNSISEKLYLNSLEDAEYITTKAIRDGVIDAKIDHMGGFMKSSDVVNLYSTFEPEEAFHSRIQFCLNLHNESVKALRFPADSHEKDMSGEVDLRNLEQDIVAEIKDMEEDDDMF